MFTYRYRLLPGLVGVIVVALTLLLWQVLLARERRIIENEIRLAAMNIKYEIRARMDARIFPLMTIANNWGNEGQPDQERWEAEASLLVRAFPGYQAISWIDEALRVRWFVPRAANEALLGLSSSELDAPRRQAFETARKQHVVMISRVVPLVQGGEGFLVYVPVLEQEQFRGFIAATFRVQDVFNTILSDITPGYGIAIFEEENKIYQRAPADSLPADKWTQRTEIALGNIVWGLWVWPQPSLLAQERFLIPQVGLGAGLLLAVLLSAMVALVQTSYARAQEVEAVNANLNAEIAERQRVEIARRESEERFRRAFDDAAIGMALVSSDGRWLQVNHALCELVGYRERELLGLPVSAILHRDDLAENLAYIRRMQAGDLSFYQLEQRYVHKSGHTVWIMMAASQVRGAEGQPLYMVVQIQDIAARKQAEELLRRLNSELEERVEERTAALARANADLRQLATVSAHDLQEPLRMVVNYTQLLAKRYRSKLDAAANEFIGYAVEGATRMHDLLNAMRAYLEIEMTEEDRTDTDCEAIFAQVLQELDQEIRESRARITHDPLPIVWADAPRLKLVLQHLLANALKFHNTLPPHVHVSAEDRENEWRFRVCDNGIGIEPPYVERVFEMFERLHTHTAYPGTGMGLTLCKKIIAQHGGRIWVEAAQGQGAVFIFTLGHKRGGKESQDMQHTKA